MTAAREGEIPGSRFQAAATAAALGLSACAAAGVLQGVAFSEADPWLAADFLGGGFLLVFVAAVVVDWESEAEGPIPIWRRAGIRPSLALLTGTLLLLARPVPLPPLPIRLLAAAGAALAAAEVLQTIRRSRARARSA
ncbi:MAG: hypothetical protein ACRENB_07225 [Gemmatimonadales bacterium]